MTKYFFITIAILIVVYIVTRIISNKKKPIVTLKIGTENGNDFTIQLYKYNDELSNIEYVSLVIWFLAKILYTIPKDECAEILELLIKIPKDEFDLNEELRNISIRNDNPKEKKIEASLFFKDLYTRYIFTKIPNQPFKNQYYNSFLVLYKTVNEVLDENEKKALTNSLKFMSKEYSMNHADMRSFKTLNSLPKLAFFSSVKLNV